MIGFFSTEPISQLLANNPKAVALTVALLESGTLPKTDVLLLPAYYNLDDDTRPADLNTGLIGVNEVISPDLNRLPDGCFYTNGWPRPNGVDSPTIEIAGPETTVDFAKAVLGANGVEAIAAPAIPGLVSARIIAMIINEAHLLLQEGMATAEDIDLSMKLGTGYPLGPFAWEKLWGVENTKALLDAMSEQEPLVVIPYFRTLSKA